jgi:hypothetical protein
LNPRWQSKLETVLLYTGLKPGPNDVRWSQASWAQRARFVAFGAVVIVVSVVVARVTHL